MDNDKSIEERFHQQLIEGKITEEEYKELMELCALEKTDPTFIELGRRRDELEKTMKRNLTSLKITKFIIWTIAILLIIYSITLVFEILQK